jgi:hypothetical protein
MVSIDDDGYIECLKSPRNYSELPMWYPAGHADALGLAGEATRGYLVDCCLTLLSVGAVPAEVCSPMPYGWDIRAWEGMTPQAIADAIAERMMTTPDPFEANVWWLEPYMADEVRAARTEEAAPLDGPSIG